MTESKAYKIFTAEQWARMQSAGIFSGSPVDIADGYIHLSALSQVQGTLDKHFAGQRGLVLGEVDLAQLGDLVRWEKSRGGEDFPHVYGGLSLGSITNYWTLELDRKGRPALPSELR